MAQLNEILNPFETQLYFPLTYVCVYKFDSYYPVILMMREFV